MHRSNVINVLRCQKFVLALAGLGFAAICLSAFGKAAHAPLSLTHALGFCPLCAQSGKSTDEDLFQAIDSKMEFINQYIAAKHPGYAKGHWGIASKNAGEAYYGTNKTRFIYDSLRSSVGNLSTVCELGFNAGHSATLLLDALPRAQVFEFDLGEDLQALTGLYVVAADCVAMPVPARTTPGPRMACFKQCCKYVYCIASTATTYCPQNCTGVPRRGCTIYQVWR
jgi:hypothetical protein